MGREGCDRAWWEIDYWAESGECWTGGRDDQKSFGVIGVAFRGAAANLIVIKEFTQFFPRIS